MTKRDDTHYLLDMLVNGRLVTESTSGVSHEEFLSNREKQDSVAFRISIIGEAARHVSQASRDQIPELPWQKITGMRHRIAHDYQEIDTEIVWRVATQYVPEMTEVLTRFLRNTGVETEPPGSP